MDVGLAFSEPEIQLDEPVCTLLRQKGIGVHTIPADTVVYRAIEIMSEKHIGCLVVLKEEKLVGIISERDYARRGILQGRSSHTTLVREIMTKEVVTVTPDQTVAESMRIMTTRRIRHLPVLEGDSIVGLLSIGDLVNWVVSTQQQRIRQLQSKMPDHPV